MKFESGLRSGAFWKALRKVKIYMLMCQYTTGKTVIYSCYISIQPEILIRVLVQFYRFVKADGKSFKLVGHLGGSWLHI